MFHKRPEHRSTKRAYRNHVRFYTEYSYQYVQVLHLDVQLSRSSVTPEKSTPETRSDWPDPDTGEPRPPGGIRLTTSTDDRWGWGVIVCNITQADTKTSFIPQTVL